MVRLAKNISGNNVVLKCFDDNIIDVRRVCKTFNTSSFACALTLVLSLTVFSSFPAFAEAPTPTLDGLNKAGATMPESSEVYPESAYNLTPIEVSDPSNLPTNTITIYEKKEITKYYDPTTGQEVPEADRQPDVKYKEVTTYETVPNYYAVGLKKTEYGNSAAQQGFQDFNITAPYVSDFEYNIRYYTDSSIMASSTQSVSKGTDYGDMNYDFVGFSGRALSNSGTIDNLTGNFIGNSLVHGLAGNGAAINNSGTINYIKGDFIGNHIGPGAYPGHGGAVYNSGLIGTIEGNFIGNYTDATAPTVSGGAIRNSGSIQNIIGDFIANSSTTHGGAIQNSGYIGNITGDFIDNRSSQYYGAAISINTQFDANEDARIDSINGNFIANEARIGSAISVIHGSIGSITGSFISNSGDSAICGRYAEIESINADFIGNIGAVKNDGSTINNLSGRFINNQSSNGNGGAVFNGVVYAYDQSSLIKNITSAEFVGNYFADDDPGNGIIAKGGAIYNASDGTIEAVSDTSFVGNYAYSAGYGVGGNTYGGAIYNEGSIGSLNADFIGNYSHQSGQDSAYGGAIYNTGSIDSITGDFIGNYSKTDGAMASFGGAIDNGGTIGTITGNFIGNYVNAGGSAYGGAISGSPDTILNSNFLNNFVIGNAFTRGGAIYTYGNLNITADNAQSLFSGNYAGTKDNPEAIYLGSNSSVLTLNAQNNGSIKFDDIINGLSGYTLSLTGDTTGTISLYNDIKNANVTSQNVTIDFANGQTKDYNFISMTAGENSNLSLDVDFSTKTADTITTDNLSSGTLIINAINSIGSADGEVTIQIIKNTNSSSTLQLAIGDNIHSVAEKFVFNKNNVNHNDIFMQEGGLSLATTDTTNDSITIIQEKIYDTLQLINQYETNAERNFNFADSSKYMLSEDLDPAASGTLNINGVSNTAPSTLDANNHTLFNLQNETALNIKNTTIENAKDYAIKAENINSNVNLTNTSFKNTQGTAIQSNVDINITADNGKSEFTGNTSAIQMNDASKSINMLAVNQGEIVLSDVVDGAQGYNINLDGDDKSKITINNNVNNANISLDNTNLYLSNETYFDNSQSLSLNSGAMYLNNDAIGTMHIPTLNLNGTTNLSVDVDLANESMDRITADTYNVSENALLNVTNLNLLTTTDKTSVKILFADEPIANNVEYTGSSPVSYNGTNTVYSPIYKYNVQYGVDSEDNLGYFFFNRTGSSSGNQSDAFNPAVLTPSVATQAGAYTTQLQTFNYAFQHSDSFMNIPSLDRLSIINNNKYALNTTNFSPLLTPHSHNGLWVKPYASFESIPLNNGPTVSNINYGTLIGYDSDIKQINHGFNRVLTAYIGYNGASQRYQGVDAYQNGGILGSTATFYKGNFFNATTVSVGASVGDASTMYGSENYTMLMAGIGNKIGYNFEFKQGKYILQPNFLMSYSFINTFDYTNAANVRINSDPLHALQLSPGIKFIMNTKNGWQPYLAVNMVWNILDETKVTANDVRLPSMSIDPYVSYGAGIQKCFKDDRFTAYGQAMVHNGGRNGISLTAGFRWKVGRE